MKRKCNDLHIAQTLEGRKDICSQESGLWHCVLKRPFSIVVIEHFKNIILKFKFLLILVSDSLFNDFMYIYILK